MYHIGQRLHVAHAEVRLEGQRLPRRLAEDQMGFNFRHIPQHLQHPHAIDSAAGARNANNQSFHVLLPLARVPQTLPDYSLWRNY